MIVTRDLGLVQTVLTGEFMRERHEYSLNEYLEMRELEAEERGGHEGEDEDD